MFLVWVAFLLLTTISQFLKQSITKDINVITEHMIFPSHNWKGMKNKFCSRIFQIITAYVKDTNKLKFICQSWKAFFSYFSYYSDFIVITYLFFLKTPLIKCIPFFPFSINPAHTHSTFFSDFIYLFRQRRVILFEHLNIKFRALFSCNVNQASNKVSAWS